MPELRILSEDTTYCSIPAMPGSIGLLCSKIVRYTRRTGPIVFRDPQALVGPSLRSGRYNHGLQVSENNRSLLLVT